jgi:hypothetical protein|tara:strand:+ start:724 stop:1068 length:345 start_codon:yes stop_codon:yes gene_type:complete
MAEYRPNGLNLTKTEPSRMGGLHIETFNEPGIKGERKDATLNVRRVMRAGTDEAQIEIKLTKRHKSGRENMMLESVCLSPEQVTELVAALTGLWRPWRQVSCWRKPSPEHYNPS